MLNNWFERQQVDAGQQKHRELDVIYTEVKHVKNIPVFNHVLRIKIAVPSFWHNYTNKYFSYHYENFCPSCSN
jgi:hypothetical protein